MSANTNFPHCCSTGFPIGELTLMYFVDCGIAGSVRLRYTQRCVGETTPPTFSRTWLIGISPGTFEAPTLTSHFASASPFGNDVSTRYGPGGFSGLFGLPIHCAAVASGPVSAHV